MEEVVIINGIRYVPEILFKKKECELKEAKLEIRQILAKSYVGNDRPSSAHH